jgi:hypothetical protein
VKYCPNPDCGGLAEFKIVSEFNDTATACADCGGPLKDGPAPDPRDLVPRPAPTPDAELVSVGTVRDQAQLILVEEALEMAEIAYLVKGEGIQDLFGFGRLTIVNPVSGPVEVFVMEPEAKKARQAIEEFLD